MKRKDANSYDISLARDLSLRLTHKDSESAGSDWMEDTAEYIRFPARRSTDRPGGRQTDRQAAGEKESVLPPTRFDRWEELLAWGLSVSHAESAFVLDSEGFVVAHMGEVPSNGFDGSGAELAYSMDQLDRVNPERGRLRSANLKFEDKEIFGFKLSMDGSDRFTLGIITENALSTSFKEKMIITAFANLPDLL